MLVTEWYLLGVSYNVDEKKQRVSFFPNVHAIPQVLDLFLRIFFLMGFL